MPDGSNILLLNRKIKHAVRDLGAVQGNETPNAGLYNDRAAAKASRHLEVDGGYIDGWEGVFRFRSPWTIPATECGGIVGCGHGFVPYPFDFPNAHGTVFRHEGLGDFITLSGVKRGGIRNVAFAPVRFKSSGSEIIAKDRCNTLRLENLWFQWCNRAITVENSVYVDVQHVTCYSYTGDAAFYVSQSAAGVWNEKTIFKRCNAYQTGRYGPVGAYPQYFIAYTPGTPQTVPIGYWTEANGIIWQAIQGGTTSGAFPATPNWFYSTDPTNQWANDGTVKWGFFARIGSAGWLADSGGNYMIVDDCESNAPSAVKLQNTFAGGTAPKVLHVRNCHFDHNWSHIVQICAGAMEAMVHHNTLGGSAFGNGVNIAAGADKFIVTDNLIAGNPAGNIVNNAGTSATKIVERNVLY